VGTLVAHQRVGLWGPVLFTGLPQSLDEASPPPPTSLDLIVCSSGNPVSVCASLEH
jgi:hypothetical protein